MGAKPATKEYVTMSGSVYERFGEGKKPTQDIIIEKKLLLK